eukprot:999588-Pyramimonas_sp.AAC.1
MLANPKEILREPSEPAGIRRNPKESYRILSEFKWNPKESEILPNPKGMLKNASESEGTQGIPRNPTESSAYPDGIPRNPCADRAPFPPGFALARLRNP